MRKLILMLSLAGIAQAQTAPSPEDRALKALGALYLQCTEVNGNLQKELQRLQKENAELKQAKEGTHETSPATPAPVR